MNTLLATLYSYINKRKNKKFRSHRTSSDRVIMSYDSAIDYLRSVLPPMDTEEQYLNSLSRNKKKNTQRVSKIFNLFFEEVFGDVPITPAHMVAYMVFRIVGKLADRNPSPELERYAGTLSLVSYQSFELGPLIDYLQAAGRITFDRIAIRLTIEHKRCREYLRNIHKEANTKQRSSRTHAVWFMDEARLVSSLSMDFASKRDRAIIMLLRRSGCRVAALCAMRVDFCIVQMASPLTVIVSEVKTGDRNDYEVELYGEDEIIFRTYWDHRMQICSSDPHLFINKTGQACTPDDVSETIRKLSQLCGLGYGYFSAHSFRHGNASREAAHILYRGGHLHDVRHALSDGKRWTEYSTAVIRYFDMNVRKYFGPGYNLTWEEFKQIPSEIMHNLTPLKAPHKRPLGWFAVPQILLRSTCSVLGCDYTPHDEKSNLIAIADAMSRRYSGFNTIVERVLATGTRKSKALVERQLVGCLLQESPFQVARLYDQDSMDRLVEFLCPFKIEGDYFQSCCRAFKVIFHRAQTMENAVAVADTLSKRYMDRRTHIMIYPDHSMRIIRGRRSEQLSYEQQSIAPYCRQDAHEHFPSLLDAPISPDDTELVTIFPPPDPESNLTITFSDVESDEDVEPPATPERPCVRQAITPPTASSTP